MTKNKKEFVFIKGKGWWFKDPSKHWLHMVPLSDRLELAIIDILRRKIAVTFDDVLQEIYTKFTNALAPTRKRDIRDILEEYAERDKHRMWRLKSSVREHISKHSLLIEKIAFIGSQAGFMIWIGKREQAESIGEKKLEDYVHKDFIIAGGLSSLKIDKRRLHQIENIDVLWISNSLKIEYAFEVEYTTAITEALRRLKSIPYDCVRVVVIPKARNRGLIRKIEDLMITGMLNASDLGHFRKIFFEELEQASNINELIDALKGIMSRPKGKINLTIDVFL